MCKAINEKLGAYLLNHTREELARKLGMTRPTLFNRMNGETEWTWSEIISICELTGATPNELAGIAIGSRF